MPGVMKKRLPKFKSEDVPYQSLLKMFLADRLEAELKVRN